MKAIGRVPPTNDQERRRFDEAVKECIETINGVRGEKISPLSAGASLKEVVAKVNELLGALR